MEVWKIVALCVSAALMAAALRPGRPEMAAALSLAAGVIALSIALPYVREAAGALKELGDRAGLSSGSTRLILRAAGVALLAEFGAELCRDAGEGALAGRIEFGARAALFSMSVPLLTGIVEKLTALLPG